MKNYDSLIDALADLKRRGYDAEFEAHPFCLYCGNIEIRLNPEQFSVDETYRFEGKFGSDCNTLLYAISSTTGVKGTLVDSNLTRQDHISPEIVNKLRASRD
ncbi:MAG: phosphoribosylpyrophosphate synthetase [Chitinophagaceae bacterium]